VVDGEVVAMDADGRPSFNTLQNHGSSGVPLFYYLFDVIVLAGKNLADEPLDRRRELLQKRIFPKLDEPIRHSPVFPGPLSDLVSSVRQQGLEGLVAKRRNSI
jgi:bifunctional non-homologous end joining protein LigD